MRAYKPHGFSKGCTQWMTYSQPFRTIRGGIQAYKELKADFSGCYAKKWRLKRGGGKGTWVLWLFCVEPKTYSQPYFAHAYIDRRKNEEATPV